MDNGPLRSGRKDGRPSTGDADFRTARRAHLPKSRPRRLAPGGFAAPSRRRFPLWMGPNICSRERKAPALGPGAAPDELPLAPDSSRKYLKVKGIIRIMHSRLPERGCPAVKAPKSVKRTMRGMPSAHCSSPCLSFRDARPTSPAGRRGRGWSSPPGRSGQSGYRLHRSRPACRHPG